MSGKNVDFLEDCALLLDGIYATDWADGNPINIKYRSDRINPYVGADGSVTVAETNDNSAELVVKLKQTSPTNSQLSEYSRKKETFSITFEDSNRHGRIRGSGNDCRVLQYAEITRGKEVTERQWTIFVPNLKTEE